MGLPSKEKAGLALGGNAKTLNWFGGGTDPGSENSGHSQWITWPVGNGGARQL